MIPFIILGLIQGILEWLPVSSEGFVVMASYFMQIPGSVDLALYLHLGTLMGVLVYFRSKIRSLITIKEQRETKGVFIAKTTLVSLLVAFPIYLGLKYVSESSAQQAGSILLALTGVALVVTGFLLRKKSETKQTFFSTKDALFAGLMQGLAVIPGLSRSGTTLFALLNRGYEPEEALETSFLMSVPVVLAANVFLQLNRTGYQPEYFVSLLVAFLTGLISIHFLMSFAKKINFSWFCWFFGALSFSAFFVLF